MKLSVVIPVYNGADFIQKSYDSIIHQHLEDFEIIYVDNNSQDDSVKKIEKLVKKDPRVKLYMEIKQGAAPARNTGIKNAVGDYLYIFDVDDEIYPNALKRMISVLNDYSNVDAVFGKMVKSYKGISETFKPSDETHDVILKEPPYWGVHWFSSLRNVVGPPGFLYRKKVFDTIGVYNESLKNDEDTALDIKLGMTSRIAFLDTYVYLYFKHHDSTIQKTKQQSRLVFSTWKRLTKEHLPFFIQNSVPDEFKEILFRQLFSSMGKLIYYSNGFRNRKKQRDEVLKDIIPIYVPLYIKYYLTLLVFLPLKPFLKLYVYYISKRYVDRHLKGHFNFKAP